MSHLHAAGFGDQRLRSRLGPYAIHLAAGRVTRDGEPITIDVPSLAAGPWLRFDDKLLETICTTAIELAQPQKG